MYKLLAPSIVSNPSNTNQTRLVSIKEKSPNEEEIVSSSRSKRYYKRSWKLLLCYHKAKANWIIIKVASRQRKLIRYKRIVFSTQFDDYIVSKVSTLTNKILGQSSNEAKPPMNETTLAASIETRNEQTFRFSTTKCEKPVARETKFNKGYKMEALEERERLKKYGAEEQWHWGTIHPSNETTRVPRRI